MQSPTADECVGELQVWGTAVLVVATCATCLVLAGSSGRVHLHHYMLGFLVSLACVFPTRAHMLLSAMCIAVHIHGVALFGCEDIFYVAPSQSDVSSHLPGIMRVHRITMVPDLAKCHIVDTHDGPTGPWDTTTTTSAW